MIEFRNQKRREKYVIIVCQRATMFPHVPIYQREARS